MPFSHLSHYFCFKYTTLVSSTMLYEKGFIYVPLASRSFGESVSKSTLYPIFTKAIVELTRVVYLKQK